MTTFISTISTISAISTLFRPYFDPIFSISVSCIVRFKSDRILYDLWFKSDRFILNLAKSVQIRYNPNLIWQFRIRLQIKFNKLKFFCNFNYLIQNCQIRFGLYLIWTDLAGFNIKWSDLNHRSYNIQSDLNLTDQFQIRFNQIRFFCEH